jgi:FtsH-binding integral membrane protein
MTEKHHIIPVWFFVGLLLLIYGVLIFIIGVTQWSSPPENVQLTELHAPVWWGALLIVLGALYSYMFRPGKSA